MNALIRLWNIISTLGDRLERTAELVGVANGRLEQSLGLDRPQVKLIDVSPAAVADVSPVDRQDASPEASGDESNRKRKAKNAAA